MANRTIRTPEKRASFLEALGAQGNVTVASQIAGVARNSLYQWQADDPDFAEAWQAALVLGTAAIEDEVNRRAMGVGGSDILLMFMLKALKPEKYRERRTVDVSAAATEDLRKKPIEELRAELDELTVQRVSELRPQDPLWGRLHRLIIKRPVLLEEPHAAAPAAA